MGTDLHLRTKAWLGKARSDLRTAAILSADENPPLDAPIYHCQQAGEKAVKAFLHHHEAPVQRTHNVTQLAEDASKFHARFDDLLDDADLLTPLATSFRYPDETDWEAGPEPTRAQFDEALAAAQRIYDFVLSLLPSETHPT
jgi:HEPN domain-containing protein